MTQTTTEGHAYSVFLVKSSFGDRHFLRRKETARRGANVSAADSEYEKFNVLNSVA